jgi:hypothetical protein
VKEHQRRQQAIDKAQAALDEAEHDAITNGIEAERAALAKRASRGRPLEKQKQKLDRAPGT